MLLSLLELKAILSLLKHLDQVLITITLFLMKKGHLCKSKDNRISYFETDFFITFTAAVNVYCLPEFLLHTTILTNFLKARFHSARLYGLR